MMGIETTRHLHSSRIAFTVQIEAPAPAAGRRCAPAAQPAKGPERSAPDAEPLPRLLNYRVESRPATPFI